MNAWQQGHRPAAKGADGPERRRTAAARRLVIVESPAKARTIAGYLGKGYVVESSIGHIRDMPDKAAEIPAKYRKEPWARLGVNVDHDFEPLYVVNADKKQQVTKLKQLLKDADELLLATDEDREGEAIAWHLLEELKPKVPARRMVFHEITPEAIAQAVAQPARPRPRPGRRLPDPARAGPAVRLRGLAGAVEEGHAAAVGRPGPVGRHPAGGRPGAGADRVPRRPSTGTWRPSSPGTGDAAGDRRRGLVPGRAGRRWTGAGSPRAATSPRPASCATRTLT